MRKEASPLGGRRFAEVSALVANPPPSANLLDIALEINQTETMRVSARLVVIVCVLLLGLFASRPIVHAQTATTPSSTAPVYDSAGSNFPITNVASNVPQNHNTYTQIVFIDILSTFTCELTGINPSGPQQGCVGVNPSTGQFGMATTNSSSGQQQQVGGALGAMTQLIGSTYIPAVSTEQYTTDLADNFGIVRADAATPNAGAIGACSNSFGYGFCGLTPIFVLWKDVRDMAYALLTILFIVIGIGVMVRFRVDPRTVMTLQNQIPRVIIAILLITFSYAICGIMIDLMWTTTYAGINFISSADPQAQVMINCDAHPVQAVSLSQGVEDKLLTQPLDYVDRIFSSDCNGNLNSGLFRLSNSVTVAFGTLVTNVVQDLFGWNFGGCSLFSFSITNCIGSFFLWLTQQIVRLIILVAILMALFRLWFSLIKCYVTFLIAVIMGPIWIVFGLIPGRPLGFEKWLRIIFANLAVFPLVAFILVFARVLMDALPGVTNPQAVFMPPLVGNPNITTFSVFLGFGAIMIAPTIPDQIKERMKATGSGKFGPTIAAGLSMAANATTAMPSQAYKHLNKRDQYGNAIGAMARGRDYVAENVATKAGGIKGLGWVARQHEREKAARMGPTALAQTNARIPISKFNQRAYKKARKNPTQQMHPTEQRFFYNSQDFDRYWQNNGGHDAWAERTKLQIPEHLQTRLNEATSGEGGHRPLPVDTQPGDRH